MINISVLDTDDLLNISVSESTEEVTVNVTEETVSFSISVLISIKIVFAISFPLIIVIKLLKTYI